MTNSILAGLLNGAIVSALVAAAVALGLYATPRRILGASSRYLVWWAALIATVALPLGYLRIPAEPANPVWAASALSAPVVAAPLPAAPAPAASKLPVRFPAPRARVRFPVVFTTGQGWGWILVSWAAVSALLLLRLLASCLLLERRKRNAIAAPEELRRRIAKWLPRPVTVLSSPFIATPVLAGLRRPAILLPSRILTQLTDGELEQIGLHEAAHLARRDDCTLLAQRFLEALFPFHPVVRWIARQIDLEREIACDDVVVDSTGVPRTYAACLTRVVELCGGAHAALAGTGVAGDRSQLAKRIDRLLDRNRSVGTRPGRIRIVAAIGVVVVLALLAGRTPRAIALVTPAPAVFFEAPALPEAAAPAPVEFAEVPSPAARAPQTPARPPAREPVQVSVQVEDQAHRDVSGLTKESFEVLEDGVSQQIAEFSVENIPLSVAIIVDVSGSMRDKQQLVDAAVTQLVKSANTLDEFLVITANDDVRIAGTFAGDTTQILSQLHLAEPRGGTAIRDAMFQALQWKNARYPSRMLVVISDGADNSSSIRIEELRDVILAAKTPIWAIMLASPGSDEGQRRPWLHDLADESRGHEFVMDDAGQVASAAASIAAQPIYIIKYQSTNTAVDGKYRQIRVRLLTPQQESFTVRHRAGYYAGGR